MKHLKPQLRHNDWQRGNTIIELLIVILIVGTVLTALAMSMTYSIKNTSEARYRDYATSMASEPIEFLRYQRADLGWLQFKSAMLGNGDYCITKDPDNGFVDSFAHFVAYSGSQAACTTGVHAAQYNQNFRRIVSVSNTTANSMTVRSEVLWTRPDGTESDVTLEQTFYNIQPR